MGRGRVEEGEIERSMGGVGRGVKVQRWERKKMPICWPLLAKGVGIAVAESTNGCATRMWRMT